jgi:hypothetical protein
MSAKKIPVKGSDKPALVDPEDYGWASEYEWFLDENGYAVRRRQLGEAGMADDADWIEMGSEVLSRWRGIPLSNLLRPRKRMRNAPAKESPSRYQEE